MSRPHTLNVIVSKADESEAQQAFAKELVKRALGVEQIDDVNVRVSPARNYQEDYQARFNSLASAALFLFNTLPVDLPSQEGVSKQALINFIEDLRRDFPRALERGLAQKHLVNQTTTSEIDSCQRILKEHTLQIVAGFMSVLGVSQTTATSYLSLAEKYYLLQNPRHDLITFSEIKAPLSDSEDLKFYVIQRENPLPPFSDAILDDMWKIRKANSEDRLPEWYLSLDAVEKHLLLSALKGVYRKEEINVKLANLSSRLRTLPGVANFRRHEMVLANEKGEVLESRDSIASSMVSSRDVLSQSDDVRQFHTVENIKQIVKTNYQKALSKKLEGLIDKLRDGSKVTLPLNLLLQTLITPLAYVGTPDAALFADKQQALVKATAELKAYFKEPKAVKVGQKTILVQVDFNIISTNHPLNVGDKITPTAAEDTDCLKVIGVVRSVLDSSWVTVEQKTALRALLKDYQDALADTSWGSYLNEFWSPGKRELVLSSLEQLMFNVMNDLDYGSCVSGKDRKALEILYTDSMRTYHLAYGEYLPYKPTSEQRQRFVSIFAQLYLTRHHHASAGLNAPGACGTKTPTMYLPQDIQEEIQRLMRLGASSQPYPLADDDKVASNNDVPKIIGETKLVKAIRSFGKKVSGARAALSSWWAASEAKSKSGDQPSQLDSANVSIRIKQRQLDVTAAKVPPIYAKEGLLIYCLQLVKDIVGNHSYWGSHGTSVFGGGKEPEGISGIRGVFQGNALNINMLPAAFQQVIQRSIHCSTRADETEQLYRVIEHLYLLSDDDNAIELAKGQLGELYQRVLHKEPVYQCPGEERPATLAV